MGKSYRDHYKIFLSLLTFSLMSCNVVEGDGAPIVVKDPVNRPDEPRERTQPEVKDLKVMAFSDFNINTSGTYNSATKSVVSKMIENNADIILGAGDYIDGEKRNLSDSTYIRMWESFLESILRPILNSGIPFAPSPGNHDAYYSQERGHYSDFWQDKKPNVEYVDASNFPFYYTYKKENVFFLSLDSTRYWSLYNRDTQLRWIREQLQSNKAQEARARIVYGHIPMYSVASKRSNSSEIYDNGALKGERRHRSSFSLEAILLDNNVDLAIFGHSHTYYGGQYTYPTGETLNVVSLPCAGGSKRYLVGTSIRSTYGYLEFNINRQNQIDYQYYDSSGKAVSDSNLPTSIMIDSSQRVRYYKKD